MSDWTIRPYRAGDEQTIIAMHDASFRYSMSLDQWNWYFRSSPAGPAVSLIATTGDDRIIGHYAAVPVPAWINGRETRLSLGAEAMVHPNFRKRGLMTALGNYCIDQLSANGETAFFFAFFNDRSGPAHLKHVQFIQVNRQIPFWIRPLNFGGLVRHVIPFRPLAQIGGLVARLGYRVLIRPTHIDPALYTIKPVSAFDTRVDDLWQASRDLAPIMTKRDHQYLTWRYSNSTRSYTIFEAEAASGALVGYLVMTVRDVFGMRAALVMDILTHPGAPGAALALLNRAVEESAASGCDLINCMMLAHLPYVTDLKRAGFRRAPSRLVPQELFLGVRSTDPTITDVFLAEETNWHVTWGDHDSF